MTRKELDAAPVTRRPVLPWLALSLPILVLLAVVAGDFDGLYGPDSFDYFQYAVGQPDDHRSPRWIALLRNWPPGDGQYPQPPGYPTIVSLLVALVGITPFAGQLASALSGAALPVIIALLARQAWKNSSGDSTHALIAGSAAACTGQLWQSSVVVMSDTVALAAASFGLLLLLYFGDDTRQRSQSSRLGLLALATVLISLAVLTRWSYGVMAIPCAAYVIVCGLGKGTRFLCSAIIVGLVAGVVLLWPPLTSILGSLTVEKSEEISLGAFQTVRWSLKNFFGSEFTGPDGYQAYRFPNAAYYALAPAHRYYFTPALAVFLVPGLWAVLRRPNRDLSLLLGCGVVLWALFAGLPWQNFRYSLACLPPLAVFLGIGASVILRRVGNGVRPLVRGYLMVGIALMAFFGWNLVDRFMERKASDLEAIRWVEERVPPDSRLVTFQLTAAFRYYSQLDALELYGLKSEQLKDLDSGEMPVFLFIDMKNLEEQWTGMSPWENYESFRRVPGVVEVGYHAGYTLFRMLETQNGGMKHPAGAEDREN